MISAPIQRYGGKGGGRMRKTLVGILPDHEKYVEVFGGAGTVLLAKRPCRDEVFNDLDHGLINFYRVLQNQFDQFMRKVSALPYSRELYLEYLEKWESTPDDVERAAMWFLVARQSFNGGFGNGFRLCKKDTSDVRAWMGAVDGLQTIYNRLRGVCIECQDFRVIMKQFNHPDYLLYLDPPYPLSTRKCSKYLFEMTEDDHRDLIKIALPHRGMIVLSGYDTPIYQPLKDAGWTRVSIETTCAAAGRVEGSTLQGAGSVKAQQARIEQVWRNPLAMERTENLSLLTIEDDEDEG